MILSRTLLFFIALVCLTFSNVFAQATVTFNVNLQPQLKDSIFIPGRDWIEISGSQYPFTKSNNRLSDTSTPKDSVYSITLDFLRSDMNQTFNYNFVMYLDGKAQREGMRRQIRVRPGKQNLDALYFDAYAW